MMLNRAPRGKVSRGRKQIESALMPSRYREIGTETPVLQMSATIIDFNAFRPNRPVADSVTRDRPSTTAAEGVLAGLFFYPVFWLGCRFA